jgi:hypothetical protein
MFNVMLCKLVASDIDGGVPIGLYPLATGDMYRSCAFAGATCGALGLGLEVDYACADGLAILEGDGEVAIGG